MYICFELVFSGLDVLFSEISRMGVFHSSKRQGDERYCTHTEEGPTFQTKKNSNITINHRVKSKLLG